MALTVKGKPISQTQIDNARTLLQEGGKLGAQNVAQVAIIYAAMGETDLGTLSDTFQDNGAGHWGVLQGHVSDWPNPHDVTGMAQAFYTGTGPQGQTDFHTGAISFANQGLTNPAEIAVRVEVPSYWPSDAYARQWPGGAQQGITEAQAIVQAYGSGALGGGTFGAGGTGTPGNPSSLWTVGDASNPDQDYYTTINQHGMSAQWYVFTDGEFLFVADGIKLMAQQPAAVISRLDPAVIHAEAVYDNCLALDTPIPTPNGWTTMGNLNPGDAVFGSDGKPTRVLGASAVHDGHDCYRVTFSDGTSVVADDGHLWETVSVRKDVETEEEIAHQRYRGVRTTKQIAARLKVGAEYNHRVKIAQPLDVPERALPIDPYVLGYWLGDGTCGSPIITVSPADMPSLVEQVEAAGYEHNTRSATSSSYGREFWKVSPRPAGQRAGDSFGRRLRDLGVLNDKHIPDCYKTGSIAQRLALLQGLMDSDGSVSRDCQVNFANKRLAADVLELIRSLGFAPTISEKPARGRSRPQAHIQFATKPHLNVFRLSRKANRCAERLAAKTNGGRSYRTIRTIERVPSVPVKCISVGTPDHLYLAGEGMIPTHNSAFQYTTTHHKRGKIQRRTSLAKVTSPTEVTIQQICPIDKYRAGDTVVLAADWGPAAGVWLIGDCTRSIYNPFSELTLVQAMQPINAATGLTSGPNFLTGGQASAATSGTVMSAMISEAESITKKDYPYVWGGGHSKAGTPDGGTGGGGIGFDCSGAVAAVLAAGGLWQSGSGVPGDSGVIQQLLSENKIAAGQGTGNPECTLFDHPGVHIFLRLNGQYFGTSDGSNGNASQPHGGAGWLFDSHSDASSSSFNAYHVPASILGQQAGG